MCSSSRFAFLDMIRNIYYREDERVKAQVEDLWIILVRGCIGYKNPVTKNHRLEFLLEELYVVVTNEANGFSHSMVLQ